MSIDDMSLDEAMGDKWRPGVHYVEQAQARISILAAEVRRLQAMLEPTPDARELAMKILATFSEAANPGYRFIPMPDIQPGLYGAAQLIAAHDARLLDEAVERGVAWLKTLHHEPEEGLPWSGKIQRMQDLQVQTLRAAIKGAAHE